MRMFICERTAPCPMTFWVGRWVAATRVTASARPSRAMVSVYFIALGRLLGQLGVLVDDDHQRGHVPGSVAIPAARGRRGSRRGLTGWPPRRPAARRPRSGVVARRSMHAAHGLSSMPRLRSMAQMTTSRQAARLRHEHVEPAALARSGRAAEDGVPAQEQHAARFGVLERSQVDRLGDGGDRRSGPRDRVGVRVAVKHPQFDSGWPGHRGSGRRGPRRGACRAPIRSRVSSPSRR